MDTLEKPTVIINAFAGPGAGKTTSCLEITEKLKKKGFVAEYVQEYAKELVWENKTDLLNGSLENQFEILKEQLNRIDRLYGKVDYIVTDAPILLNSIYLNEVNQNYSNNVLQLYNQFNNFNYFVNRSNDKSLFETKGRIHDYEQSVAIDNQLRDTLDKNNIKYEAYNHSAIDTIVDDVIQFNNKNFQIEDIKLATPQYEEVSNQAVNTEAPKAETTVPNEFERNLLGRLKADCDYFLQTGAEKHLWAGSVEAQIDKINELFAKMPDNPHFTRASIDDYASKMREKVQEKSSPEISEQMQSKNENTPSISVKIPFSESRFLNEILEDNKNLSFPVINELIKYLDEKQHYERFNPTLNAGWYDKTDFEIQANISENNTFSYSGRIDIGDGEGTGGGSLTEHIEEWANQVLNKNPYHLNDDELAEYKNVRDVLVPFMQQNEQLIPAEQKTLDTIKEKYPIRTSKEQYESLIGKAVTYDDRQYILEKLNFNDRKATIQDKNTGWYPMSREVELTELVEQNIGLLLTNEEKSIELTPVGDFYEVYGEAAKIVAKQLDLHLLQRDGEPMVGFPKHSLEKNREILAKSGYNLSVIEPQINNTINNALDTPIQPVLSPEFITATQQNFRIEDDVITESGAKTKFRNNIAAIQTLKLLEKENRNATTEEQTVLSKYSGWGGLANAFEPNNSNWSKEYSQLKEILTNDEYTSARASVLDAFYTEPVIIDSIYNVLENSGFKSGDILDPSMGVGNFFGRLPEALNNSNLYGVEKDRLSGRIAQKLYPQANIQISGFENTNFQDNSFDVAISNIPFGDFSVNDRKYNSQNLKIHDYFFLKALDKVRDGGVVAFITSKGTLDKRDSSFRKQLSDRADLIGAVRLPNNAFKSAGTEVTSDIIFLQKRSNPPIKEPSWVHTGTTENGYRLNNYFIEHSEMVLGDIVQGNKLYGTVDDTMCVPFSDGRTLAETLPEAVKNIHFEYFPDFNKSEPISESKESVTVPEGLRLESYFSEKGKIYFYGSDAERNIIVSPASETLNKKINEKNAQRIISFIELRDTLRELLDIQQFDNTDDKIVELQDKLNELYDNYYKKYGLLHSRQNQNLLKLDGAYPLVASLEQEYDKNILVKKSDIFTQRVNNPTPTIEKVDTATEALAVCIAEKGIIDFDYMSKLTDNDADTLTSKLLDSGEIFLVPELTDTRQKVYQTASEYLSGDIYSKLDTARQYAANDIIYQKNCSALEAVLPEPLKAGDIDINLGATWIDRKYYQQFMYETFNTPIDKTEDYVPSWWRRNNKDNRIILNYSEYSGKWNITNKSSDKGVTVNKTYGTKTHSAYMLFEAALNLTEPKVYKNKLDEYGRIMYDDNNKPLRELDVEATQVVQQKVNVIKQEFKNWIFDDPERRRDILDTYNRTFNCIKPREFDGSHLRFHGMNSNIELHSHQKDAIAHAIYGGNTLFAHSVGAGKTYEMIATAMECKRLGLCHKSLFAVPNHLTEQVGADFLKLYPQANILVATKDDFKKENRKKLISKIATGNYDAVIIGHSQIKMLPLSPEREEQIYRTQINDIIKGIAELKAQDGMGFKIKEMEKAKVNLEKKLEKLSSTEKDNSIYFEELGIDKLFVDEAHEFKNLFCNTKLSNVSGISSRPSQRATELFAKCRYLDEKTGGKGVVFATGTPLSNSVTELHTMMRYLNYDYLASHNNMQNFDNWVSTFGIQKKEYELAPEGNKFKERTRISEYANLPELLSMFKIVADIRTSDTLKLNVPECELKIVDVEPTDLQKALVEELSYRADDVNSGKVEPTVDNMLKITGDGRKLGLDPRLINPEFEDNPNTKLNVCVNNTFDIYEKTSDKKLTQIIFCDLGVPKKSSNGKEHDEDKSVAELDSLEEAGAFCVYDDIKNKLIAKGVPSEEIAFIHDAKTEKQKAELFAKVRSGEVRILLGSTGKMGTGTNVQDRIIAMHDLDVPWRPADLEQRRGRMVRQGNINKKVQLYRYVTRGTFDAYSYQLLENKQKFISQIMTSKAPARRCSDVDQEALSYSEIKALCTGDERIREKLTLENRVKELNAYKSNYNNTRFELEDKVNSYQNEKDKLLTKIENIKSDIDTYSKLPKDKDGNTVVTISIDGTEYSVADEESRKLLGKALTAALSKAKQRSGSTEIGNICGFPLVASNKNLFYSDLVAEVRGKNTYSTDFGLSGHGNIQKLTKLINSFDFCLYNTKNFLNKLEIDNASAKEMLAVPFEYEDELTQKSERLSELTKELNIEKAHATVDRSKKRTCYFSKDFILHKGSSKKPELQQKPIARDNSISM